MPGVSDISFNRRYKEIYAENFESVKSYLEYDSNDPVKVGKVLQTRDALENDLERYTYTERQKFDLIVGVAYAFSDDEYSAKELSVSEHILYNQNLEYEDYILNSSMADADFDKIAENLNCQELLRAFKNINNISGRQNYLAIPKIKRVREAFDKGLQNQGEAKRLMPIELEDVEGVFGDAVKNRKSIQWATAKRDSINTIVDSLSANRELPELDPIEARLGKDSRVSKLAKDFSNIEFSHIFKTIEDGWDEFRKNENTFFHDNKTNRSPSNIKISTAQEYISTILDRQLQRDEVTKEDVGVINEKTIQDYIVLFDEIRVLEKEGVPIREIAGKNDG